jgi:hypothetical protein
VDICFVSLISHKQRPFTLGFKMYRGVEKQWHHLFVRDGQWDWQRLLETIPKTLYDDPVTKTIFFTRKECCFNSSISGCEKKLTPLILSIASNNA